MQHRGRVELDESKRDPLDFALWKASREGEPAWESPWGPGRPGWHIECSVMSTKYLGETFDFHGGGRDLIFPHHENELAQSCALGGDFVRYWMHNGLLTLDGQKMAKSTGHFFSVDEVLAEFDPDVVRYYLLRGHFRNQMEYSRERLEEAPAAYDRMRRAAGPPGGAGARTRNSGPRSPTASPPRRRPAGGCGGEGRQWLRGGPMRRFQREASDGGALRARARGQPDPDRYRGAQARRRVR